MLFPILLLVGSVVAVAIKMSPRMSINIPGSVGADVYQKQLGKMGIPPGVRIGNVSISAVDLLSQACDAGLEIPQSLVLAALAEAAEQGDEQTFREIVSAFPPPQPIALQKQSPETLIGKTAQSAPSSPLRGVSNAQWETFVSKLRTQEPSYKDARHVGAFHHNVKRLAELNIDPTTLTDETAQYEALSSDIQNVETVNRKLINDWCGDVIEINGQDTPLTHSGILGLIKSAGVEGAKQWLTSSESRMKYPNTTRQFLNTNGIF